MRIRARVRLVALSLAVLGLAASSPTAAAPSQAGGKFASWNWEFEPSGACAYPGEVGMDDEAGIDVTFDVAVAPSTYGDPPPAGGGEPGKFYAAYHQAIVAGDKAALRPCHAEKVQAEYAERADAVVQAFRNDHPDQAFKVVRGFAKGERALLLVEGETSYSKVKTEVHLEKQQGTWRIVDETLQLRMGE